jgi:hypothetical protein
MYSLVLHLLQTLEISPKCFEQKKICAVWLGSIWLADQLHIFILVSPKLIMDISKIGGGQVCLKISDQAWPTSYFDQFYSGHFQKLKVDKFVKEVLLVKSLFSFRIFINKQRNFIRFCYQPIALFLMSCIDYTKISSAFPAVSFVQSVSEENCFTLKSVICVT